MADIYAACGLIVRRGAVLAVSRRGSLTQWGLPGGRVEPGESPLDAALREMLEETGLVCDVSGIKPQMYEGPSLDGRLVYGVRLYALGKPEPHSVEPGIAVQWMMPERLCDPNASPFAKWNRKFFEAVGVL